MKVKFRVRCVKTNPKTPSRLFTVGKTYDFYTDGERTSFICDDGFDFDHFNPTDTITEVNHWFRNSYYQFELVTEKPTKAQLKNLKVGDKVRLGDGKYSHWVSNMKKYRNQVVTIGKIFDTSFEVEGDNWSFLLYRNKGGKLESDIVEIISSEPPTPTETIPEKKEEPTVEQITPEAFKEAVINFISKLPYTGGTVSFAICEAERARIIEGIRELDIT